MKRIGICTVIALVAVLALSTSAMAAPGGNGNGKGAKAAVNGNGGTIVLDQSAPHFGDQVTFTVSTSSTDKPWVFARCYQSGVLVYDQRHGLYDDYRFEPVFTLGPTMKWTGGGANCVADLVQWVNADPRVLATTQFDVAP
jgi:hypothetical protein